MLVFPDGSTHDWFLWRRAPCDLIVTLDDTTSEILSAFFVEQEGTMSSFSGLADTITGKGLFSSFYTDRGSHYFLTPKAGGKVDESRLTQVGRALMELGVQHIPSYAPEGRGRMERVFGTLQGRLPPLLRLAGIDDIESANRWLERTYIGEHNSRFAVAAAEEGSAFITFAGDLASVLCVQVERVVGNDNCVRYEGRVLQIPEQAHRRHYVRAAVRVHEYRDGSLAVFHGPRRLAAYDPGGAAVEVPAAPSSAPCSRPSRPSPAGGAAAPALTAAARRSQKSQGRDEETALSAEPRNSPASRLTGHLPCQQNRTSACVIDTRRRAQETPFCSACGPLRGTKSARPRLCDRMGVSGYLSAPSTRLWPCHRRCRLQ